MKIASNEKFACLAFHECWLAPGFPDEIQLAPNVWAAQKLDVKMGSHWARWVGSLAMDALTDASLVIYTTMPSANPEALDGENKELARRLDYVLYGLLLQGVPRHSKGFAFNGANSEGEVGVRQFSNVRRYLPTYGLPYFRPGVAELQLAMSLAPRLRDIGNGGANWERLRGGIKVLLGGSEEEDSGERLHDFVRALEALLRPDIGSTKTQFAHRTDQTFVLSNAETRDTLLEIYEMRSRVEHLHPVLDALQGNTATRIATANRRTCQIDALARRSLRRVVGTAPLLETFRTEANIAAFWNLPDAARVAAWSDRWDLRSIK